MTITAHLCLLLWRGGGVSLKKCLFLYKSNDNRTARFVGRIDFKHEQSQYVDNYNIEQSGRLSKMRQACK